MRAKKAGEKPRKLLESDYLLGVYDEARMGGLRFKTEFRGGISCQTIKNMQHHHGLL